jgi:hypothetical protein
MFMAASAKSFAFAKETKAPNSSQSNDGIAKPSQPAGISVCEPGDEIKLEKAPQSPVKSTGEN